MRAGSKHLSGSERQREAGGRRGSQSRDEKRLYVVCGAHHFLNANAVITCSQLFAVITLLFLTTTP